MRLALAVLLVGAACVRRPELPSPSGTPAPSDAPISFSLARWPGGEPHALSEDRGNVVLLDVWATWCEPCKDALPMYEQVLREYGPRGLRVYAISVDEDPRQIERFVQETKLTLPILLDKNGEVAERELRVKIMPTSFLLDRSGRLRFVHEGFAEQFLARYQSEIEELLAEPAR